MKEEGPDRPAADSAAATDAERGPHDDDAVAEALAQISVIEGGEDDRRKTTDAKLSSAQSAIGFIVTLAGGSVALAFLQTPVYDVWHALVILALLVSVGFFVWAAVKIVAANDPSPYQTRTATAVRRLLLEGKTKRELQLDAISDLVDNIERNGETNNTRLTLYRAAIENIRKGVIAAGLVPLIVVAGYAVNAFGGSALPRPLRIGNEAAPASSATPSPAPSVTPGSRPAPNARNGKKTNVVP